MLLVQKNPAQAEHLMKYFRCEKPGDYGYGDVFIGIRIPIIRRQVMETAVPNSLDSFAPLFASEYHDIRLFGGLMLEKLYNQQRKVQFKDVGEKEIIDYYLSVIPRLNNWDLVDVTCYKILGAYIVAHPDQKSILFELAKADNLWKQRVAIVSTMALIKNKQAPDLQTTFDLAQKLFSHPHDLIRKAVGWLLRECGKVDEGRLVAFLREHKAEMSRTALRYAIERFDVETRRELME